MQSAHYSCYSAIKFEFSRQIFEKYLNTRFNENPSSVRRFILCGRAGGRAGGRTDGYYGASSRFLQYCELASKRTSSQIHNLGIVRSSEK